MLQARSAHDIEPASRELEQVVEVVESRLAALGEALRERDSAAIESQATELHSALSTAVQRFVHVAHHGGVPEPMRRRLARASALVATQRESLARATAALDRAIDVLIPPPPTHSALYAANGLHSGGPRGGMLRA